jgi:predicted RNase H-like HicB family nuclease
MGARVYRIPGRKSGLQTDFYICVKGETPQETQALAAAAIGKARGALVQESEEFPGHLEILGLSASSISDAVLSNAAMAICSLNNGEPLPTPAEKDQTAL